MASSLESRTPVGGESCRLNGEEYINDSSVYDSEPKDVDIELKFDGSYLLVGDTTITQEWPDDLREMPEELAFLQTLAVSIKVANPPTLQEFQIRYREGRNCVPTIEVSI